MSDPTIDQHFDGRQPVVRDIYDRLLAASREFGYVGEDPKKTSIHLNRNSAFAGVRTQNESLILTVKSPTDIESPRINNKQKASANRWYCYIKLESPDDVDAEITEWLKNSYDLSA